MPGAKCRRSRCTQQKKTASCRPVWSRKPAALASSTKPAPMGTLIMTEFNIQGFRLFKGEFSGTKIIVSHAHSHSSGKFFVCPLEYVQQQHCHLSMIKAFDSNANHRRLSCASCGQDLMKIRIQCCDYRPIKSCPIQDCVIGGSSHSQLQHVPSLDSGLAKRRSGAQRHSFVQKQFH